MATGGQGDVVIGSRSPEKPIKRAPHRPHRAPPSERGEGRPTTRQHVRHSTVEAFRAVDASARLPPSCLRPTGAMPSRVTRQPYQIVRLSDRQIAVPNGGLRRTHGRPAPRGQGPSPCPRPLISVRRWSRGDGAWRPGSQTPTRPSSPLASNLAMAASASGTSAATSPPERTARPTSGRRPRSGVNPEATALAAIRPRAAR